ncbi:MAG: GNAT family N-acetyltransferase [Rikenellaceae bacterium]
MKVDIYVAQSEHTVYAEAISKQVYESAQARGTGIAERSPEYIVKKIIEGKAVIAIAKDGDFAGFSYIESWSHSEFVANSGLIVAPKYRNTGLARAIKFRIFNLSRTLYPQAKVFSITTGLAVMKLNYELGYRPVTFAQLTTDPEFWEGCNGCKNIDILKRNDYRMCLCTALLYDPQALQSATSAIKATAPVPPSMEDVTTIEISNL